MKRRVILLIAAITYLCGTGAHAEPLQHIRVSDDGTHFVEDASQQRFIVWGVNYDHDSSGRLLDEYWLTEWNKVVEDFREIKELGANCVRVHLQLGKFMDTQDKPNTKAFEQLRNLVALAEEMGIYLDITGLACYHKQNIPKWYDELDEEDRWAVQAVFWESVAQTCKDSPAIFCYDLMNEPILPGKTAESDWLTGELGGKYFVQRLTLDLKGRSREQVAEAWVKHDDHRHTQARSAPHDHRGCDPVGICFWRRAAVVLFSACRKNNLTSWPFISIQRRVKSTKQSRV